MKLSDKEIECIAEIEKSRKRRKTGAWLNFLLVLALWYGVFHFDLGSVDVGTVIALLSVATVGRLLAVHFGIRPEDKLIDLLQRYVRNDAEAVLQLSGTSGSEKTAA